MKFCYIYPSSPLRKVPPSQGYPLPLGTEGSGTVVATGGGALAAGGVSEMWGKT